MDLLGNLLRRMKFRDFSAALLVTSIGCSASLSDRPSSNPCGPGGRQRTLQIVATTRSPNGDTWDWIPAESQTGGQPPATPPPVPMIPGPPRAGPDVAPEGRIPPGPPGTVPMLRPRSGFYCECGDGYQMRPEGTCVDERNNCVGPGGWASGKSFTKCCPELVPATATRDGTCQDSPPDAHVCIACGDGICGLGEKPCNCPRDCR
jgi:hypothetical protein